MRSGVGVVMAVALVGVVVVAVPAGAVDQASAEAMKEEARARMTEVHAAGAAIKAAKVVKVNCNKPGASVQAALDANPGPVTIEIQGICVENVRMERRSDVTLIGRSGDPSKDGLVGVADPTRNTTLEIRYSTRVALRDLSFNNATRGAGWYFSDGEISNCDFNDNSNIGLNVAMMSSVTARNVEASRNVAVGIRITRYASLSCQSCDVVGNAPAPSWDRGAVWADDGAFATFWDSVVSGSRGLIAWGEASYVDIDCEFGDPAATHACSLSVEGQAGVAVSRGEVAFLSLSFAGSLRAQDGLLTLSGAQQEQGTAKLTGASELAAGGGSDKQGNELESRFGPATLQDWTRATLGDGTVIDNPVTCTEAADAILKGATFEGDGSISGCEHASGP